MNQDEKNPFMDALQSLFEQSGHSAADAHRLALETMDRQRTVSPGVSFGGLHSERIGQLWEQAQRTGTRQLLLEITAEGANRDEYHGQVRVRVIRSQRWDEYERAAHKAAERLTN